MYKIVKYATWNKRSKHLLSMALSQLPMKTGYVAFFVEPLMIEIKKCNNVIPLYDKNNKPVTWKGVKIVQQVTVAETFIDCSAYTENTVVCHN